MSNRITLDELKSYLWNSAVLLRTSIDAGAYKQYIFPHLNLEYRGLIKNWGPTRNNS